MKRIAALALSLALMTGVLGGCAREKEPYIPTGGGLLQEDATKPTAAPVTEQRLSIPYFPDRSLNPFTCTDATNKAVVDLVYQGLFTVDESYTVWPVLCKSYSVSWDMKTYTFYLENATFSDGVVLTAQDVVASLNAARESDAYSGRFGYVEQISGTEDGAVSVSLTTACENLPMLLDVPIVKQSQLQDSRPLGTGPYFYDAELAKLHRRTDWWCAAALPVNAETVELVAGTDAAQLRDEFEFDDLSLVCTDPGSEDYVDFHSDYELWDCESGIFLYLVCKRSGSVLSVDAVRQALRFAIDRKSIVSRYYHDFATEACLPASPGSPFYSTVLAERCSYEPEKLTQAVTEAQVTGSTLVLLVNKDDGVRLRAARFIAKGLEQCGLKITTSELATADYRKALEEGAFDLYLGQTKLSPNMDLSAFFAEDGALRYGDLSDPTMHALCLDALANSGNYYTLHDRILEGGQLIPILFRSYAVFTERGAFPDLVPARDHLFFYHLDKTLDDIMIKE